MRTALTIAVVFGIALAAAPAQALDRTTKETDAGAGPIRVHVTDCLIVNRTHTGTPCPEPQVPNGSRPADIVAGRLLRAWYFIDMQDLDKARAEADLALDTDPANVPARHLAARLSLSLADKEREESDIAIARQKAPDDPDVAATYAMVLESRPARVEALRVLHDIVVKHPHHWFARLEASRLLLEFHDPLAALANLTYIINEREPDVSVLELRADAYGRLGQLQQAAADLERAIKLERQRFDLKIKLADVYLLGGASEAALRQYNELLATQDGAPIYVMFEDDRAKLLTKRAFANVRLNRLEDAANDMIAAVGVGGKPAILRAELMLRHNGYADLSLDGQASPELRKALTDCFAHATCLKEATSAEHASDWRR
jgi:tetratricopeptide (TPR) repeat protein